MNILSKLKHQEEEQLGESRHEIELNAEQKQTEQDCQAEQNLEDLEYFKPNKNEVTFKIVSA